MKLKTLKRTLGCGLFAALMTAWIATTPVFGAEPAVGLEQTPIDIRAEDVTLVDELPELKFRYSKTPVTAINTGSPDEHATVRADVPAGAARLTVNGKTYQLLQFHWHTPAEHLLQGGRFPLEMHFVHRADDGSLLVVGVWIEEGKKHKELDKIFGHLPEHPGDTVSVARLNLKKLLPGNLESFRYKGSLTTPPFTEGVSWVVLADSIEMSAEQIEAFQHLFHEGNSREVQPLNGRQILSDIELDCDHEHDAE